MYQASKKRYEHMIYDSPGGSGLKLPKISLGFWHNFGDETLYQKVREMALYAFDHGITHFDFANNYGKPGGSAEKSFGRLMEEDLKPYRDELVISTKAGFYMWDGPYGDGGSRKYLFSSLNQSLKRMNLDYVDIFYHHRHDPDTPLEETMNALTDLVRMGKTMYIGLSNYPADKLKEAVKILKANGTPPVLFQPHFSMLDQKHKHDGELDFCEKEGIGVIPYSIFNQGLLTGKYLDGIPENSRMMDPDNPFLTKDALKESLLDKLNKINDYAKKHERSMTEIALRYVLSEPAIVSSLVGVSKLSQLKELIMIAEDKPMDEATRDDLQDILEG